jgi:hypothetical protein
VRILRWVLIAGEVIYVGAFLVATAWWISTGFEPMDEPWPVSQWEVVFPAVLITLGIAAGAALGLRAWLRHGERALLIMSNSPPLAMVGILLYSGYEADRFIQDLLLLTLLAALSVVCILLTLTVPAHDHVSAASR